MNRRQILQSAAALAIAPQPSTAALVGTIRPAPAVVVDWIARYNAVYRNESQGNINACHHCMANVGMQAVLINVQNQAPQLFSWPFAHYRIHGTFANTMGSWSWQAAAFREQYGVCRNELYSQEALLSRQANVPYPAPPAECYADEPSHKLTKWSYLFAGTPYGEPPDMSLINQLLLAGYPITFGRGGHAGCLLRVDPDNWYYSMDSLLGGVDAYTHGPGVRPLGYWTIYNECFDFCVYQEVASVGAPSLPSQAALLATIRADAAALTDPPTHPQVDTLLAHIDLLRFAS